MHKMIPRVILEEVFSRLQNSPAVALLGPRQCGKSTLARVVLDRFPDALMLDLERPTDRAMLEESESFFDANSSRLICLDEVQDGIHEREHVEILVKHLEYVRPVSEARAV